MTTIEKEITFFLRQRGLWEEEAKIVIEEMKNKGSAVPTDLKWGSNVDDYPTGALRILKTAAKRAALNYIDHKAPKHWARGNFE